MAFYSALDCGVLYIATAGNSGTTTFSYPISYLVVMSVAVVDSSVRVTGVSQKNSQVEIAARAHNI